MDWSVVIRYFPLIGRGLIATVWLSLVGISSGSLLGVIVALMRMSRVKPVSWAAVAWVTVIRSIPLLLLLFATYYLPPVLLGFDLSRFVVAWAALTIYCSAYTSEIIRSGLLAVPKLQRESGLALGLTKGQVLRLVVFPQALRTMLPSYMGLYTVIVKDSSLVAVIGYIELTRATRIAVDITYEPFQFYLVTLLFYFLLCYPVAAMSRRVERKLHAE